MGALSLLTFFSRKRKLVVRLLGRDYEERKAKACETIIRSGAIRAKIAALPLAMTALFKAVTFVTLHPLVP